VIEFTVTVTGPGPAGAVFGTAATICVLLQLVTEVACAPLKLTVLVPCVAPKFEPAIVTDVPVPPRFGDTPVTKGVVPTVTDMLSKVPVASADVLPLLTAKPTYTFWAMLIVWLVPTCVQLTPSVDIYPLKVLPVLTSFTQ
jgi:hypothetical protein